MAFQTFEFSDVFSKTESLIDLSDGQSLLIKDLILDSEFIETDRADLAHLVLPSLDVRIQPDLDPEVMTSTVVECLWEIFTCVRNWYLELKNDDAAMLVWAWPGETTARPDAPENGTIDDSSHNTALSLLPSLSGMLRCMALELGRPIVLVCTDSIPQRIEIRDFKAFFMSGTMLLGEFILSQHHLYSYEPRLDSNAEFEVEDSLPLKGHVLSLGGARGIVAEMLSRLISPHSHLSVVGRTALECPDADLVNLSTTELMRALMERYRNSGTNVPMNPRILQQEVDRIGRQVALGDQLDFLRGKVAIFDYHSVNLLNYQDLDNLLRLDMMTDVNVLVSGAGVIQDQSCLKKTKQSFEAVLRTKVVPLCVFLAKGLPPQLKTWVCFSSIASKSGNPGQADYAAANEFLNTVVLWFSHRAHDICMRTINWGPWHGTGMASDEVLKAFHSRGLEPIKADQAALMIRHLFSERWNAVEVSGVSLQKPVLNRIVTLQSLIDSSSLWSHHLLPVKDISASDKWPLVFHGQMPYLQGHKKHGRCVVPAATILAFTADLPAASGITLLQPIRLSLYVFHGITLSDSQVAIAEAQVQFSEDCKSGQLFIMQGSTQRKHYQVSWACVEESYPDTLSLMPIPDSLQESYLECCLRDVYSACLFHSGVMARLSSNLVIDPDTQTSWARAHSVADLDLLGLSGGAAVKSFPNWDFAIIDSLLQLLLVQVTEIHGFSLLPQELEMVLYKEIPINQEVQLTVRILSCIGSCLEAIGACFDQSGEILFIMKPSKFTVSQSLLDYPPGIARPVTALG